MYMEGVKDGKRFMKVAARVSKKKPIIILKGGRTEEGAHAVSSHTGSLAGSDAVYDAVFKQTGVIRVRSMTQMFNFARILSEQPIPRDERVAIITNGGGFGVLATDEVIMKKMKLAKFSEQTSDALSKMLPAYARVNNPLDLVGDADDELYKKALEILEHDPNVDVILCIVLFQTVPMTQKVVDYIIDFAKKKKKPIAVCSAGGEYTAKRAKKLEEHDVPVFDTPSSAVDAIDALVDYSNIRKSRKWTYD
jgi:acyl-CoA synthetase (NDP forming)